MMIKNNTGGILAFLFIVVLIIIMFAASLAYFLYKENYLRFEYGPPPKAEDLVVYDENMVNQIKKREETLRKSEIELDRRKEQVDKLFTQFEMQKQFLVKEKEEISAHLAKIESFFTSFTQEEEDKIKKLARLYETMKATKVAPIFAELDKETVAELLSRMNNRASAKILAEIGSTDANRAADISNIIQGKEKSEAFSKVLN
jgi:flagellar motility protein MotE (MotC chaperone)